MLDIVLAFFWYPDGPASPLEMESDSAMVESRDLFRVGGTLAVVGIEGLRPARLLVPLVVGVEDTEVTTGGEEVEAWGWSVWSLAGVITALGGSSMASLEPDATDTTGIYSVGSRT